VRRRRPGPIVFFSRIRAQEADTAQPTAAPRNPHVQGLQAACRVVAHGQTNVRGSSSPWLVRRLLRISPAEASFVRRRFRWEREEARLRLEHIGEIFLAGYEAGLQTCAVPALRQALAAVPEEDRGFAYEGAAMALAAVGLILPWRWRHLRRFMDAAAEHVYMVHVGVGWAAAALRRSPAGLRHRFLPLDRWLIVDGAGFFHGYFRWPPHRAEVPVSGLAGYAGRAFDQGLGRSLWFREGGSVAGIVRAITTAAPSRQADLWSGVGLACAYAGGVPDETVLALQARAGAAWPALAQGACFAAAARQRAGNPAPHTERVSRLLCGRSAAESARVAEAVRLALADPGSDESYERWRHDLQAHFAGGTP
jgi:enediyne biosynthesis protein E3